MWLYSLKEPPSRARRLWVARVKESQEEMHRFFDRGGKKATATDILAFAVEQPALHLCPQGSHRARDPLGQLP